MSVGDERVFPSGENESPGLSFRQLLIACAAVGTGDGELTTSAVGKNAIAVADSIIEKLDREKQDAR